jgi:MFS family permease
LVLGLLVAATGMTWTSDLGPQASLVDDLLCSQLLTGIGFGLAFVAGTVSATSQVPLEHSGIAAGAYNTSQQLGGAIGLAVLAAVAAGAGSGDTTALTADLSQAFRVAAGFAAVAAVGAWLLLPRAHHSFTVSSDGPRVAPAALGHRRFPPRRAVAVLLCRTDHRPGRSPRRASPRWWERSRVGPRDHDTAHRSYGQCNEQPLSGRLSPCVAVRQRQHVLPIALGGQQARTRIAPPLVPAVTSSSGGHAGPLGAQ